VTYPMGDDGVCAQQSVHVDVVSRRIRGEFTHPNDRWIPIEEFV